METEWWWTGSIISSAFCFVFSILLLKRMIKDFDNSDVSYKREQDKYDEINNNDMHLSFLMAAAIKWDNEKMTCLEKCFKKKSQNTSNRQLRGYEIDTLVDYLTHAEKKNEAQLM